MACIVNVALYDRKKNVENSFKNDEKCFLYHFKSSFHSQDIQIFVLTFWSCRKKGFIRKTRLISKFMTSQPG